MKTSFITVAILLLVGSAGCSPKQASAEAHPGQAQAAGPVNNIDQLLAPIALYPDQLLAQMLMCAQDPPKVSELDTWLQNNRNLKGTALQDAAVRAGFEPSFVAMALFPQVISKMAEQIDRTTLLGQAFTANRNTVFDAIQRLRKQAQMVGTLKTNAQQEVETQMTSAGQQVIVIEPANPQVVYVPQYNVQTVYTQAPSTTVVVHEDNTDEVIAAGMIGFTAGIVMGAAVNNSYYYGPYGFYGGAYMYNDAWDDYYDHREDAREDWMDHREDLRENRSENLENRSENRNERLESTSDQRTERRQTAQENRTDRTQTRQENGGSAAATARSGSSEARGYSSSGATGSTQRAAGQQRGTSSDAFSGYSSGTSQRSSSSRGQASRSSSRGSRGGGGRRR